MELRRPAGPSRDERLRANDFERADGKLNRIWRRIIADVQASDRVDSTRGGTERRYRAAQRT